MQRPWYLNRVLVVLVLAVFLRQTLVPSFVSARSAEEIAAGADYSQAREDLAVYYRRLAATRASLPETDFEPAALADFLGRDGADAYRFVRDEVAYEPYRGVLRHAQGALMSRAGNAFDQASLLAETLRARGHQVRLARAMIGEDDARRLLAEVDQPPIGHRLVSLDPADDEVGRELNSRLVNDAEAVAEQLAEASAAYEDFADGIARGLAYDDKLLRSALDQAGLPAAPPAVSGGTLEDLVAAARDHAWVQIRRGEDWVDLDPSTPWLALGERLAEPGWTGETFPQELFYRLAGEIVVSSEGGDAPAEATALSFDAPLTRAVNDFALSFVPEPGPAGPVASLEDPAFVASFKVVWPALRINGKNFESNPFDLKGRIVATDPAVRAATEMGETTGDAIGGAGAVVDCLFGCDDEAEAPAAAARPLLSEVTLRLRLIGPQGELRSLERMIARRDQGIADKAAADMDLRRQLMSRFDAVMSGSRIAPAFFNARYLDNLLANRSFMFMALAERYGQPLPNRNAIIEQRISTFPFESLALLHFRSAMLDANVAQSFPGVVAYPGIPQVVAFRQVPAPGDEPVIESRYDIMVNAITAYRPSAGAANDDAVFAVVLQQGVLDTLAEYLLLGGGEIVNAHAVTARADTLGVAMELIAPGGGDRLDGLDIPAAERAAMRRDLDAGFAVLAPAAPVQLGGQPAYAWWRIDPVSGETLGMAAGEGQALSERAIQFIALGLTMGSFCVYFAVTGSQTFGQCMIDSMIMLLLFIAVYVGFTFIVAAGAGYGLAGAAAMAGGAVGLSAGHKGRGTGPRGPRPGETGRPGRGGIETPGVEAGAEGGPAAGRGAAASPGTRNMAARALERAGADPATARNRANFEGQRTPNADTITHRQGFAEDLPPERIMQETGATRPQMEGDLHAYLEDVYGMRNAAERQSAIDRYFERHGRPAGQPAEVEPWMEGETVDLPPPGAETLPPPRGGVDPFAETTGFRDLPTERIPGEDTLPPPGADTLPPPRGGVDPFAETMDPTTAPTVIEPAPRGGVDPFAETLDPTTAPTVIEPAPRGGVDPFAETMDPTTAPTVIEPAPRGGDGVN
jgi:transglutaminase-like putative cysteine protease